MKSRKNLVILVSLSLFVADIYSMACRPKVTCIWTDGKKQTDLDVSGIECRRSKLTLGTTCKPADKEAAQKVADRYCKNLATKQGKTLAKAEVDCCWKC